jgi:hypothetical protein
MQRFTGRQPYSTETDVFLPRGKNKRNDVRRLNSRAAEENPTGSRSTYASTRMTEEKACEKIHEK